MGKSPVSAWDGVLAVAAMAVIAALFLAAPGSLLDKVDRAAYAVCHRLVDHSYIIGGRPLPLCARCSGTYLGALAGFAVLILRRRGRATLLPARRYLAVLAGFMLLWAIDGANSYLTLFPGLPYLYEPHNLLRLATGTLEGLAIASVLLPVLNLTLWHAAPAQRSIGAWRDLAWLLAGGALVIAVVNSQWTFLLYALAILSGVMIVVLVGALNLLGLLLVLRRDSRATTWSAVAAPAVAGLALAMTELGVVGIVREALTIRLGLPF